MEYANKNVEGRATAGLTTGIIGTALGVLNGGLGGIMGGLGGCNNGWNNGCHENMPVNRYELGLQQEIAAKDSQIALRDANIYGDQKLLELYKYFDGEIKGVRNELCRQAVVNQKTEDSFLLVRSDLQRERDERCCGDNAIINYSNATFYPKMVADVSTGSTTTAQMLYNPLPSCGCCK
jgi:hypothetical protein